MDKSKPIISHTRACTLNRQDMACDICGGNELSSTSTSLEKRDRIRPTGVVSKKSAGNRNTPVNRYRCNAVVAMSPPRRGPRSLKTANSAAARDAHNKKKVWHIKSKPEIDHNKFNYFFSNRIQNKNNILVGFARRI